MGAKEEGFTDGICDGSLDGVLDGSDGENRVLNIGIGPYVKGGRGRLPCQS